MRPLAAIALLLLTQCGPKQSAGESSDSDTSSSSGGETSTGTSGDTGAGSTVDGETGTTIGGETSDPPNPTTLPPNPSAGDTETSGEPGDTDTGGPIGPFACPGARWVHTSTMPVDVAGMWADSRGHVYLAWDFDDIWEVRDHDADGVLVNTLTSNAAEFNVGWGGADAADNWYAAFQRAGFTGRVVRKFDAAGAVVWERELGPAPNDTYIIWGFAVAPNGATVLTERWWDDVNQVDVTRLVKHDAGGTLVLDEQTSDFIEVLAVNDQGTMAAIHKHEQGGSVLALAPDATIKWSHDKLLWDGQWAGIDAGGNLYFAILDGLGDIHGSRYAAGGALVWDAPLAPGEHSDDFQINQAGTIAVSGRGDGDFVAHVARFDAAGQLQSQHACSPTFGTTQVAIDPAGTVYLAGSALVDDVEMKFIAAFD